MSQIIAANAFKVVEGRPVTSSRIVAEYFGKQHHHVVRDIRTLISQKPDLERNANFGECSETINLANGSTRQVPFFWMDRKGFSLLAMGFTGAKALDFKCAFYDQFERMEEALRAPSDQSALITTTEQYEIRKAIKARAKNSSVHYQTVYRALKDHFKVEKYTHILEADFDAAIDFIESLLPMELPPPNEPAPKQISAAPQGTKKVPRR